MKMHLKGIVMLLSCLMAGGIMAQTPYSWRGPERMGVYPETGLLKSWPQGGPQQIWETLDAGKGSIIYADGTLYLRHGNAFMAYKVK